MIKPFPRMFCFDIFDSFSNRQGCGVYRGRGESLSATAELIEDFQDICGGAAGRLSALLNQIFSLVDGCPVVSSLLFLSI